MDVARCRFRVSGLAVLLVLAVLAGHTTRVAGDDEVIKEQFQIGSATVTLLDGGPWWEDDVRATIIRIEQGGSTVWERRSRYFSFAEPDFAPLPRGSDINADGYPDLLVVEWAGGNCCVNWLLFTFDPDFRLLFEIQHLDLAFAFRDLDGKPGLEIDTFDGFSGHSAGPRLVLAWDGRNYVPAPELLATPDTLMTDEEVERLRIHLLDYARDRPDRRMEVVPGTVTSVMETLVLVGQICDIPRLIDRVWPEDVPGRVERYEKFKVEWMSRQDWPELVALNDGREFDDCPTLTTD